MRSANNVELHIGARVAALDEANDSWIYPGIITGIEGDTVNVTTDGAHIIPRVISSHIWVIDLFADRPRQYWGYPNELASLLSNLPLYQYFNRPLPIRVFGKMLCQCIFLYLNNAVFENKIPQPNFKISNIIHWAKVNRNNEMWLGTRTDTLRQLYNSIAHEAVHLYQFKYETNMGPDDLLTGYHGSTFLKWREPLSRIGIILNPQDTSDTEAEIAPPGARDKPQLVLLIKTRGQLEWSGGLVNNEKIGRMLVNMFSSLGNQLSLVWVRNVQITRALLPMKAKRGQVRTPAIPDNVIAWIAQHGQPVRGFPLPEMPEPKQPKQELLDELVINISATLTNIGLHNKLVDAGFKFSGKVKNNQQQNNLCYSYTISSPVKENADKLRQLLTRLGFTETDPSRFVLSYANYRTTVFGIVDVEEETSKPPVFFVIFKKFTIENTVTVTSRFKAAPTLEDESINV